MQEKDNGIKILKKYIALKLATIWLRNIRRITKKKMKYPSNFGQPVVPHPPPPPPSQHFLENKY